MSACRTEIMPLLGAFADGELSPDERERVQQHLAGCGDCRARQAFLAAQGAALRERVVARAAERPAADFTRLTERVMARVAAAPPRSRLGQWSSSMWAAHRAAVTAAGSFAVAACLALAVFLQPGSRSDEGLQQAESLADAAQTQVDEVDFGTHDGAVLRLHDKTSVIWLGEDHAQ